MPILPARTQPPHASLFPLRTLNLYQFLADGYDIDMKTAKFFIFVTIPFLSTSGYSQEISTLIQQFDYDSKAALDMKDVENRRKRWHSFIKDITFASPKGGRVGAYLIMPSVAQEC